ncbi:MarR family transcriptional regulator [Hymenobacter lutimineralis]|uniref:MarR family transcriptional regulator n=1 Tax=Hymenobacter lutimineralis TaxID=2606448 RepID=A0A5D6UYJ7_9BACT|nr:MULTISPECIES: MarR family transcriptional regulator [Hymenobacter]QIX62700.1 MarR family transcriptional regulator [Hymenobacter sp. BT18]TYZ07599.1 MarR family transcriptional regulator [Hymenobacter lutimineralis]
MNDQKDSPHCNCLFFSANALGRLLTGLADQAFSTTGLAPSLAFVVMNVNRQPGIQPSQLSDIMKLTPSTVSRLVEKLEYQGYLRREATGRTTQVQPTDKGQAIQPQLQAAWRNLYTRYSDLIGVEAAKLLTQQSNAAIQALEKTE